jgi:hypothetical protein
VNTNAAVRHVEGRSLGVNKQAEGSERAIPEYIAADAG